MIAGILFAGVSIGAPVDGGCPAGAAPASVRSSSVLETAASAGQFETLVKAVKAAGLEKALSGEGPFTVFAPTDEAFAALPEGTLASLLEPAQRADLRAILEYHVVAGDLRAASVVEATGLATGRDVLEFLAATIAAVVLASCADAAFVTLIGWKDTGFWDLWQTRLPSRERPHDNDVTSAEGEDAIGQRRPVGRVVSRALRDDHEIRPEPLDRGDRIAICHLASLVGVAADRRSCSPFCAMCRHSRRRPAEGGGRSQGQPSTFCNVPPPQAGPRRPEA